MFRNKELILFDFDGTLIDSVPDLATAVNHMLTILERPSFEEIHIRNWIGNGARPLVQRALDASYGTSLPTDESFIDSALEIFMAHYAKNLAIHTKAYPGVLEVLQALHVNGFRMAIVTNKPYDFIAPILEKLKLDHLFEYYIGGDSLPQKKPDPLPLLHVCEKLGIDQTNCVMVGDSKNDILAAKAAGVDCIGVSYGYNYEESLSRYAPDLLLNDFYAMRGPFGVIENALS